MKHLAFIAALAATQAGAQGYSAGSSIPTTDRIDLERDGHFYIVEYYNSTASSDITVIREIGDFQVRVRIEANPPEVGTRNDAPERITVYPPEGWVAIPADPQLVKDGDTIRIRVMLPMF